VNDPAAAPRAPAGLSRRSAKLWREVVDEFDLSPAELELLRNGLVALDRADTAGAIIEAEGMVTLDRYGSPKMHPAVDVEARSRTLYARCLAQLGIKTIVEHESSRSGAKPGPRPKVARLRSVGR
jgi:hypothetical protein